MTTDLRFSILRNIINHISSWKRTEAGEIVKIRCVEGKSFNEDSNKTFQHWALQVGNYYYYYLTFDSKTNNIVFQRDLVEKIFPNPILRTYNISSDLGRNPTTYNKAPQVLGESTGFSSNQILSIGKLLMSKSTDSQLYWESLTFFEDLSEIIMYNSRMPNIINTSILRVPIGGLFRINPKMYEKLKKSKELDGSELENILKHLAELHGLNFSEMTRVKRCGCVIS